MKLLLVEDDILLAECFMELLKSYGHEVTWAKNGVHGISTYHADPTFDAVITDLEMPHMDGLDMITEFRKRCFKVPIYACTGVAKIYEDELLFAGADGVYDKQEFSLLIKEKLEE